jgi:integrase
LARRPAPIRRSGLVDQGTVERAARCPRSRRPPRSQSRGIADALKARERPKPGGSSKRFLTDEEMRLILDAASGRYRTLLAVLLFTGLRTSEALGLVWGDVDLRTGHLRVRHQLALSGRRVRVKTAGSRRDVVVMDSLARELRRHRLASPHSKPGDFVFATASGSALSSRNPGRALGRIAAEASMPDVTPHAVRHTYASMLIARGRDPAFVADQLGHASPAITLRVYAHLFRAVQQEQSDAGSPIVQRF